MIECIGCGSFNVFTESDDDGACYHCQDCHEVWCEEYEDEDEEYSVGDWNWTERPATKRQNANGE